MTSFKISEISGVMVEKKVLKQKRQFRFKGWVILNKWGGLWTEYVFYSKTEARAHLEGFYRNMPTKKVSPGFNIVNSSVMVTVDRPKRIAL